MNDNQLDMGWMCREHAFFTACLAALQGYTSAMIWGRLALIGEGAGGGTGSVRVDTHGWAAVERIGHFDMSLNLEPSHHMEWKRWPSHCVAASMFYPNPKVEFRHFQDRNLWEQKITNDSATGFSALYLGETYEDLNVSLVKEATNYINSPLTDELRHLPGFDSEIYAKGVRHVWEVANHRRRSLTSVDQKQAWIEIAAGLAGANDWLAHTGQLPAG